MVVLGRSGYAWFVAGAAVFVSVGMSAVGSWRSGALLGAVLSAVWVVDATGFVRVRDGSLQWRQWIRRHCVPLESIDRVRVSDSSDVNRTGSDGGSGYWIPTPAGSGCWAA